ncbi:HDOD domain-containing protein [Planctomicrobium sp. SH661]|uniref:HDOD domain-containing protein n=1 Tax=Planctomicrobium sp. SH661 TaxID=3448124 RepID=UPI003F5B964B
MATDQFQATSLMEAGEFDLVILDLRTPLTQEPEIQKTILALAVKSILVIVRPLILEGDPLVIEQWQERADELLYHPLDYQRVGFRMKGLFEKPATDYGSVSISQQRGGLRRGVSHAHYTELEDRLDFEDRLKSIDRFLPISSVAADVVQYCYSGSLSAEGVAALIQRDAGLAAEVLRVAHAAPYAARTSSTKLQLRSAVTRLGQRRVAEIALAAQTLGNVMPMAFPWIDFATLQKRSQAAAVAADWVESLDEDPEEHELFRLAAMMAPLGHVVLGTLFAEEYEAGLRNGDSEFESLEDLERTVFPMRHAQALAHVFANWNFPERLTFLIAHSQDSEEELSQLAPRDQNKIRDLQVAIFIGRLAVNNWQPWDELPAPPPLLNQYLPDELDELFAYLHDELNDSVPTYGHAASVQTPQIESTSPLGYVNLSLGFDPAPALLASAGIEATPFRFSQNGSQPLFINCRGIDHGESQALSLARSFPSIILCEPDQRSFYEDDAQVISFPISFREFQNRCHEILSGSRKTERLGSVRTTSVNVRH